MTTTTARPIDKLVTPARTAAAKRVGVDDVPTPRLARAIRDMRDGKYVVYDSPEAVRADIEHHQRHSRR